MYSSDFRKSLPQDCEVVGAPQILQYGMMFLTFKHSLTKRQLMNTFTHNRLHRYSYRAVLKKQALRLYKCYN